MELLTFLINKRNCVYRKKLLLKFNSIKKDLLPSPNTGCFSRRWPPLAATKSAPKKLKNIFFVQDKLCSLKAHVHYFTLLNYLATWRANLGVFTHFTSINLPQCRQSINSLMYVYYTDPQLLFMSAWSQSWSYFFVLSPPLKNFCIPPLDWLIKQKQKIQNYQNVSEWNHFFKPGATKVHVVTHF